MNAKQFFDTVSRLRDKQKEYFRTRSSSALRESKQLEKQIDDEIERVRQVLLDQRSPKLF
jgi:hypothetical protein